jgi:DNA-binding transcriptional LysR family regulator
VLTLQDLAHKYGLTLRQVRWRVAQLDGLLQSHLFTGANGRVTLDDAGVAIFDRLIQLERDNLSLAAAVSRLSAELSGEQTPSSPTPLGSGPSCPACAAYLRQIEHLEEEVRWLRARLEELETRAPPPPRRRWWWPWERRREPT